MRSLAVLFPFTVAPLLAASLTLAPETIVQCSNGLGRATLAWSGASGEVQVRVGKSDGPALTGWEPPIGTASTGDWVADGMAFYLVNRQEGVEATVGAKVVCGGVPAPSTSSYLPLNVGNTWVYRYSSRQITSDYLVQAITGVEQIAGQTYFVQTQMSGAAPPTVIRKLRVDVDGRIWSLDLNTGREAVFLDPALLVRGVYRGPLGNFPDAGTQTVPGFQQETQTYIRGIGLVNLNATLLAGSSGGFTFGLELVEARLAGGIRLSVPAPRISLTTEKTLLDVTGKNVTNCAVPCYFVACGLVPGADPPGTYKPCTQARVEANAASAYTIELELRNAIDQVVYRAEPAPGTGDFLRYVQVQLYSQPNQPVPSGDYRLVTRLMSGGAQQASAVVAVRIN